MQLPDPLTQISKRTTPQRDKCLHPDSMRLLITCIRNPDGDTLHCHVQGYYRRADALFALGKIKAAFLDYKRAAKVAPRDPDLRKKLTECEKEVKRLRFEEALSVPVRHSSPSLRPQSGATVALKRSSFYFQRLLRCPPRALFFPIEGSSFHLSKALPLPVLMEGSCFTS